MDRRQPARGEALALHAGEQPLRRGGLARHLLPAQVRPGPVLPARQRRVRREGDDPCLFTVLTARNHGAEAPRRRPRSSTSPSCRRGGRRRPGTLWVPYRHRSTMQEEMRAARARDTGEPAMVGNDGVSVLLMETDRPLVLSDWAYKCARMNVQKQAGKL